MKGKAEVSTYFGNYARIDGWRVEAAIIEGRTGLWVREDGSVQPAYAIVLEWGEASGLERIRDFRYARYVLEAVLSRP